MICSELTCIQSLV